MRISLHRSTLVYGGDLLLHTASSGPVTGLDTLHLRLVDGEGVEAVGEVRVNIAYMNGIPAKAVVAEALALMPRLSLSGSAAAMLAEPPNVLEQSSAPVRMLVDMALHDLAAKQAGLPLAVYLGAPETGQDDVSHATNQCLFVSDDATFLVQANAYVERGFKDLKVRIGAGDFANDLARLRLLRAHFGKDVKLAADANASWSMAEVSARLESLAELGLSYIEQPVALAPFEELCRLAEASPLPIMLDESVKSEDDVARLAQGGHRLMAHLKLAKLGGLSAALRAVRALRAADVPMMIGQMNEGGVATAAVLHLSAAFRPDFAELYGADGLANDPASGLSYADGAVFVPSAPGLGLRFDAEASAVIWS